MTKALCSIDKADRDAVAKRRVNAKTGGLGYFSAVDYFASKDKPKEGKKEVKAE